MPLQPGTTLGPCAVTAKIGEGGIGEVRGGCGWARKRCRSLILVVCSLVVVGCGDSPTAPTILEARFITSPGSDLTFVSRQAVRGEIQNVGPGCARNVGGLTRLFDQANVQVVQLGWFVPSFIVQSGETLSYEACCLSQDIWDSWRDGGTFRVEFNWIDSACQAPVP